MLPDYRNIILDIVKIIPSKALKTYANLWNDPKKYSEATADTRKLGLKDVEKIDVNIVDLFILYFKENHGSFMEDICIPKKNQWDLAASAKDELISLLVEYTLQLRVRKTAMEKLIEAINSAYGFKLHKILTDDWQYETLLNC